MNDQRRMILAIILSALVLIGWTFVSDRFFPQPKTVPGKTPDNTIAAGAPATTATAIAPAVPVMRDATAVIGETARIVIETPKLNGSIALKGARIDDLVLTNHLDSIDKTAKPIRLLSPAGTKLGYFAGFGWTGAGMVAPGINDVWQADGAKLTPETPITLRWANPQGIQFAIKFAIDKDYMFTVDQTITNGSAAPISARGYGYINRSFSTYGSNSSFVGPRHDVDSWTLHVGPIGTYNGKTNYDVGYANLDGAPPGFFARLFGTSAIAGENLYKGTSGWLGFGDTYWLTAMAPAKNAKADVGFRKGGPSYQAEYSLQPVTLAAGTSHSSSTHFFAGAKEIPVLDNYENSLGIANFGKAIDWGWFEIVAKPIFKLLNWFFKITGNFGFAIILLTLTVKALMFPIAQRQFSSMAKMRVVQPKMKILQEKYKDDKVKLQTEMMALYQKEKINPASGCLPIFIQIPVFYALFKVLNVAIEMRHQPFVAWIKDLSAPDPLTPINLFGLLNFTPPSMIALGVLPILLGITMYLQFKLNPAPVDPVQAQMFSIMPWFLMFVMAPFAAGLQLYWVVNNTLTILQQKWLYSKHPEMKQSVKT